MLKRGRAFVQDAFRLDIQQRLGEKRTFGDISFLTEPRVYRVNLSHWKSLPLNAENAWTQWEQHSIVAVQAKGLSGAPIVTGDTVIGIALTEDSKGRKEDPNSISIKLDKILAMAETTYEKVSRLDERVSHLEERISRIEHAVLNDTTQKEEIVNIISDRITAAAWLRIIQCSKTTMISQARTILTDFLSYANVLGRRNYPALTVTEAPDGSLLIEWLFANRRLGFNIEPNQEDSGWYYVATEEGGGKLESGFLADMNIEELVQWAIQGNEKP